jgi:membrane protease YdiL (CAAX protease family)
MNDKPPTIESTAAGLILVWVLLASLMVWGAIFARLIRRQPLVPYEGRRRQPWRPLHVAAILVVYIFLVSGLVDLGLKLSHRFGTPPPQPPVPAAAKEAHDKTEDDRKSDHPLLLVLQSRPDVLTLLLALFSAGLVAPLTEEFAFRLLLQGQLESMEMRYRRWMPWWRRIPPGVVPVTLSTALFAAGHFREAQVPGDPDTILVLITADALARLGAMTFAILFLHAATGATSEDLGLIRSRLGYDLRLGVLCFLAFAPLILGIQAAMRLLLPGDFAPDPIALAFLAAVLGVLYFRTHRLVSAVVVHMLLNTTSLLIAWLAVRGG